MTGPSHYSLRSRREIQDKEVLADVVRSTHMPMVITDPYKTDNPIVYANEAFEQLTGYKCHEIIGRNCRFLCGPDTDRGAIDRIRDAIHNKIDVQVDILNYRKDGTTFWNALYLSSARGGDGNIKFFIASQIDITSRVEASRMLSIEKAKAEADSMKYSAALDELAAAKSTAENAVRQKAEFVANMSHELRTPLTGILGLHDLLQADPTLGPAQRRYLIMARDAGQSLLAIVDDILDFSKIEARELSIERVALDFMSVLEYCEDLTSQAARAKGLPVHINTAFSSLVILGDTNRLRQMVLNLISNAIKFTEHGSIDVTATFDRPSGILRCEVADSGIGISDDKIPLLFKRFTQADTSITRRFGGTGLGLAICESLVKLMGGRIGVTSKLGVGSVFWFEVPTEEVEGDIPTISGSNLGIIPPRRVLLAEDNPVNQEIIKSMLEARGHDVAIVENGAAAVAAARSVPTFDIILMDLHMPIMDGLSASRAIRLEEQTESRASIPIIALTANAMAEDVNQCREAGMNVHVAKPIKWIELYAAMENLHV